MAEALRTEFKWDSDKMNERSVQFERAQAPPAAPGCYARCMAFALKLLLAALMVAAGVLHFVKPKPYLRMMPSLLPAPLLLVYLSGVAEVLGGLGLLLPQTQRLAAWGLVALFVAIFPANVNMAVNKIGLGRKTPPAWALWARLPLQGVLIAWAWWFT